LTANLGKSDKAAPVLLFFVQKKELFPTFAVAKQQD
jgi:hypothetical protein